MSLVELFPARTPVDAGPLLVSVLGLAAVSVTPAAPALYDGGVDFRQGAFGDLSRDGVGLARCGWRTSGPRAAPRKS